MIEQARGTTRVLSVGDREVVLLEKGKSKEKSIQLGLCCMNITLKQEGIYTSRKMIQRTIHKKGIDELKRRILCNLEDVVRMIEWNECHGIRVFRLSSELFPHKTNPLVENYTFDFAKPLLQKIGTLANKLGHRLTFHPGQYNVLGTPHEDVFQRTQEDLGYHADLLDLMGLGDDSVMVIHAGGFYGDREATIQRWCRNYQRLPKYIQKRLVLENCEKAFSIKHCLRVSHLTGVPIVLDTHHFECYQKLHPDETFYHPGTYIPLILETWERRGIKPKFHISQQGSGRIGHHSDFIDIIPQYLLDIPQLYQQSIDIMVEAKKKELAIAKLYHLYPELDCRV